MSSSLNKQLARVIRTRPNSRCCVCGGVGAAIYSGLRDRIATAEGEWDYKKCKEPQCGVMWLDPAPHADDIWKAYQDYFTHDPITQRNSHGLVRHLYFMARTSYLNRKFGYVCEKSAIGSLLGRLLSAWPTRANYIDANVMYLPFRRDGRLLDIGCGGGAFLQIMQQLGWEAEGIDFDPITVDVARSKHLNVRLGTLKDQHYDDDSFDAIVMCHVIEHVYDPVDLIRECHRVLKPGGSLVILTPNVDSLGHRHFGTSWLYLDPPRHLYLFNESSLRRVAAAAGLTTHVAKTSARVSGRVAAGSMDISRCGRHDLGKPLSAYQSVLYELIEYAEWLYSKFDRSAGEEVVFIGTKDAAARCKKRPS